MCCQWNKLFGPFQAREQHPRLSSGNILRCGQWIGGLMRTGDSMVLEFIEMISENRPDRGWLVMLQFHKGSRREHRWHIGPLRATPPNARQISWCALHAANYFWTYKEDGDGDVRALKVELRKERGFSVLGGLKWKNRVCIRRGWCEHLRWIWGGKISSRLLISFLTIQISTAHSLANSMTRILLIAPWNEIFSLKLQSNLNSSPAWATHIFWKKFSFR